MPELELLEKACPEVRRFREEKHGPHHLVVRTSRCFRGNLGLNPSVGILGTKTPQGGGGSIPAWGFQTTVAEPGLANTLTTTPLCC